jgi:hypothetical protein
MGTKISCFFTGVLIHEASVLSQIPVSHNDRSSNKCAPRIR